MYFAFWRKRQDIRPKTSSVGVGFTSVNNILSDDATEHERRSFYAKKTSSRESEPYEL